ncbi:TniQ family protein [Nonomuraea maheshkhaliensis]|uniref:TniQ family protein n=1 Tax=Nonomuraea maheshkhaliensis TaxID=419590 RepID=UPI003D15DDCE
MAAVWPRRLALVVAPASGESFALWVDRMALRNGCPPWAMIEALGLNVRASSDVRSLAYGVVTRPEMRRAIEAATGVSSEVVRGMHLEVFDGSVLDLAGVRVGDEQSVRRAEGREWVQFFGSGVCPTCLATSGGVWADLVEAGLGRGLSRASDAAGGSLPEMPRCRATGPGRPARPPVSLADADSVAMRRAPQQGRMQSQISKSAVSDGSSIVNDLCLRWRRTVGLRSGQVMTVGQWFAALRATAILIQLAPATGSAERDAQVAVRLGRHRPRPCDRQGVRPCRGP